MFLPTTEDLPTLPQGENSYPTCQHASMFGMFGHIQWKTCEPTYKKMKVSHYIERHVFSRDQNSWLKRCFNTGKQNVQGFTLL